jgi:hypothetical protein
MAYNNPSVADFQGQFVRDFPYGTDPNNDVLDSDIAYAFQFANMMINPDFFGSQGSYTVGYNLLAAHFLVTNLRASSQGINGQFSWLQTNKNVGSVSEAFSIPQRILDNPELAVLTKTNYGIQYLSIVLPQLTGQMFGVFGPAHAL